jgi:hypothetical protein
MLTKLPTEIVEVGTSKMRLSTAIQFWAGDSSFVLQLGQYLGKGNKPYGTYKLIKDQMYAAPIADVSSMGDPTIFKPTGPYGVEDFAPAELEELSKHVKKISTYANDKALEAARTEANEKQLKHGKMVRAVRRIAVLGILAAGGIFGYPALTNASDNYFHDREVAEAQERARELAAQDRRIASFDKLGLDLTEEQFAGGLSGRAVADQRFKDISAPSLKTKAGAKDFVASGNIRELEVPENGCSTEKLPTSNTNPRDYEIGVGHDGDDDDLVIVRISTDKKTIKICEVGTLVDDSVSYTSSSAKHVYLQARPVAANNG